jgi:hypothetical protein
MPRPTPRGFYDNWANSDLPYAEKVLLALKNNAIKIKNRSNCCGNYGEPGC